MNTMSTIALGALFVFGVHAAHAQTPGMSLLGKKAAETDGAVAGFRFPRPSFRLPWPGKRSPAGGESENQINTRVYDLFKEAVENTRVARSLRYGTGQGRRYAQACARIPELRKLLVEEICKHPREVIEGLARNGDLGQVMRMVIFGHQSFADVEGPVRQLLLTLKDRGPRLLGMLDCAIGMAVAQETAFQSDTTLAIAIIKDIMSYHKIGGGNTLAWIINALKAPVLSAEQNAFLASLRLPVQEWKAARGLDIARAKVRLTRFDQGHAFATIPLLRAHENPKSGVDPWGATYPFPSGIFR